MTDGLAMMGTPLTEREQAIEAVRLLLAMCRNGTFYEDHDDSWDVLRAAEHGFDFLTSADHPTPDDAPHRQE